MYHFSFVASVEGALGKWALGPQIRSQSGLGWKVHIVLAICVLFLIVFPSLLYTLELVS